MNRMFQSIYFFVFIIFLLHPFSVSSTETEIPLDKAKVDLSDLPSMQRGARLFMNYCSSCHSLKYVRYSGLAEGLGIKDASGNILNQVVKDNLMFTGEKISDVIKNAMTKEQGEAWFGVAPPDLSLVARARGANWLYTYLRSFYPDPKRPWGVNNKLFKDVAMPDVLYNFRARLLAEPDGQAKFDSAVLDLVNFLVYVGEPAQVTRKRIGIWVMLFLGIFLIFAYLLKREYWKDVKSS